MDRDIHLSVVIMAVPERMENVKKMIKKLNPSGERQIEVCVDDYHDGIWPNAREAWMMYDPGATHHLVLQDDLILCEDLIEGTEKALSHLPNPNECMFSLLGMSEMQKRAYESRKTSWFIAQGFIGQAVGSPTYSIPAMIDWASKNMNEKLTNDDERLWPWMWAAGWWCWHTVPTLAEHVGAYVSTRNRKSGVTFGRELTSRGCFIGEDSSALEIDWTMGVENPPKKPEYVKRDDPMWAYPGAGDEPVW